MNHPGGKRTSAYAEKSALGKPSAYPRCYDPALLQPIERAAYRETLDRAAGLARTDNGFDTWHCFEVSWLDGSGKPAFATGRFQVAADTPNIVESKSLKLYLAGLNQHYFESLRAMEATVSRDLTSACGGPVAFTVGDHASAEVDATDAICIDEIETACSIYNRDASLLAVTNRSVANELLLSRLLRSNCPVTGQPDWAELGICYSGRALDRERLLQYIVSYRQHSGFHEQTVEQITSDLLNMHGIEQLAVLARYTRRGGVAISVYRETGSFENPLRELAEAAANGQ